MLEGNVDFSMVPVVWVILGTLCYPFILVLFKQLFNHKEVGMQWPEAVKHDTWLGINHVQAVARPVVDVVAEHMADSEREYQHMRSLICSVHKMEQQYDTLHNQLSWAKDSDGTHDGNELYAWQLSYDGLK